MDTIDRLSPRPASASASEQAHIVTVGNMNGANRLFGGLLFSWLDETAGVTARRHARTHVTTASVENLRYLQPVVRNQVLMCEARVIYTGRTSLEVLATAWLEDFDGFRVGMCRGCVLQDKVPTEAHDSRVDVLLTEDDTLVFSGEY